MPDVAIVLAASPRFEDAQHAFSGGGDGLGCQCQWWTLTRSEFDASTPEERTELLRDEVNSGTPPGLIAYVDGEPAAWVRVGPRTRQPRLSRTRNFAATTEPWDDPAVWAVTCFVVRKEHRGQGLNGRLLEAAVEFAREQGARVLEAYPIDAAHSSRSANDLYYGILSVFERAGFRETARPRPDRTIVTLDLTA
ncbi:GNAT family N-acetyltransferase [Microbacterium sp. P02]|uniref:GNAT family N-acetyltransferase n=1 Tax=Microbacterium sp. P02 TaxID=3366260 RepID=UPI0036727A71